MELAELADRIKTKEDFILFLKEFQKDYHNNKEEWENPELGRYLESMQAWLEDTTDRSVNKVDWTPSWKLFANILIAASVYE